MHSNETSLINRIKSKADEHAADELVSLYSKEMYAFVYKQTLDKELSLDLTQEIFISVLQSIHGFNAKKASFKTWLYKLATYRVVDYYRSRAYRYQTITVNSEDIEITDSEDFTISLEYKHEVQRVTSLVNSLDSQSQQIFRLKLFADYSFKEIAATLGLPESTIKTKYYSLLKKVKEDMEADDNE
ncbi:RNA polymerase subunit sigma-70 [Bacillus sp. FJAT-18017]|uniref:RNA polymerase sigma factor n=1 Tax=Bacillus sp. FJAT-18017 TaxID=1705566 RepID=UPI0006AF002D|nr:sigma-70 family RNA polymerase sigma factor [Bacillus sp. FJAT-18017]ALC91343.1 RNA polymerase subunit sigma-70 [Bacillus sp. FJAT-18017]